MKKYLIFLLFPFLSACTIFDTALERSAENVAKVIDRYCAETDQNVRNQLRAKVNDLTEGHTIVVTCAE